MAVQEQRPLTEKRKRGSEDNPKARRRKASDRVGQHDHAKHVTKLEKEIQESQKNYNHLVTLLCLAQKEASREESRYLAIVSLCRVFCRFYVEGRTSKTQDSSKNEITIINWIKDRFSEFKEILSKLMRTADLGKQIFALAIFMRLVREELSATKSAIEQTWQTGSFSYMLRRLLEAPDGETLSQTFVEKYASPYDDVRHWTFSLIPGVLQTQNRSQDHKIIVSNSLTLMSLIEPRSGEDQKLNSLLCQSQRKSNQPALQASTYRRHAQLAWLSLMNARLDRNQRKKILGILTHQVVPWFYKPELLMDFLVDSFKEEGATSLLSLSGLFYLMQEKNLDYPDFYTKLYSLLNEDLLHSKHRSRVFRLLNTFTSSSHLPAALVASFIKRMARLSLHAPPAGVVAVIPWVYNLLKAHPSCTFMLHRETRCDEEREYDKAFGAEDPFDMDEPDPLKTGAIDSCLWELLALQSHYHPNVASLGKIMSQQFTKQSYNLEDFLDYSYNSLIDVELGKELRKEPVVEFQIPKKVFSIPGEDRGLDQMMVDVFSVC